MSGVTEGKTTYFRATGVAVGGRWACPNSPTVNFQPPQELRGVLGEDPKSLVYVSIDETVTALKYA